MIWQYLKLKDIFIKRQKLKLLSQWTHLFVQGPLLGFWTVPFRGRRLLPQPGATAGPIRRWWHHASTGGTGVGCGVEHVGWSAAPCDSRRRLVYPTLWPCAVLPRYVGLVLGLGEGKLSAGELSRTAKELIPAAAPSSAGPRAGLAQERVLWPRSGCFLCITLGADGTLAFRTWISHRTGRHSQSGGHLVHGILERERGEQLGPSRGGLCARCRGGLSCSPQGRAAGRVALCGAGSPHSRALADGGLAVIDGVAKGGVGSALKRTAVLQVHHRQALASVGNLNIWLIGLRVTGAAGRWRLNHRIPRNEKQILVFRGWRGQPSEIHQPVQVATGQNWRSQLFFNSNQTHYLPV